MLQILYINIDMVYESINIYTYIHVFIMYLYMITI